MRHSFREFLEAEIEAIRRSIDHEEAGDAERFTSLAVAWIEKNGARFREEWVKSYGVPIDACIISRQDELRDADAWNATLAQGGARELA